MTQPVIFISYSHKDEREKNRLLSHLGVLQHQGLIGLWSDDRIGAGADWKQEISEAMAQARVAILLISANFLTSDFILGKEVPPLLKRRQSEGLIVFPVIAKACAWQEVDWLAEMNVRPKNGRPIWGGSRRVDQDLAAIAQEVAEIVKINPHITPTSIEDLEAEIEKLEKELESLPELPENLKILVVDDEKSQAKSLQLFLENSGFDVDQENDPRKVWRQVQQEKYGIIFLDMIMPQYEYYDGREVLVDIKTFSPESKVITLTGYARTELIAEVMHLGASAFIGRNEDTPPQKYLDKINEVMKQSSIFHEDELRERLIKHLWKRIRSGILEFFRPSLEGLIKLAIESIDGFVNPDTDIGDGEEIHIEFENRRNDAIWNSFGGLIQVKCTNWSGGPIGLEVYRNFQTKLTFARLGFLISYTDFTDELRQTMSTTNPQDPLIVLIDRNDLEKLINLKSEKREELLRNLVKHAMQGYRRKHSAST